MPIKDFEKRREYQRLYHLKTWNNRRQDHAIKKQDRVRLLRKWLIEYKLNLKCEICSENDFRCLDFDHLNPETKFEDVSNLVSQGWSKEKILIEIKKCQVLCANCHRKKTFKL